MINNRRGLSDVVTTVLIILLVLAAIVIVWSFVRPTIQRGSESIDVQAKCLDLTVAVVSCTQTATLGTYSVVVKNDNNVAVKIRALVSDTTGSIVKFADSTAEIAPYAQNTITVAGHAAAAGVNAKAMPTVKDTANVYQPCEAQLTVATSCQQA